MISVREADTIIAEAQAILPVEEVPLVNAMGRGLRRPVFADRDLPPFDRVMMDGIAIAFRAWAAGRREFAVDGVQAAGEPRKVLEDPEHCLEVMTGAILPEGCDCVIPYEDTSAMPSGRRVADKMRLRQNQFVHRQGSDFCARAMLLPAGKRLNSCDIAVGASCGQAHLAVSRLPRVSLISTGDELVELDEPVAPHQIRRSNIFALWAACRKAGITRVSTFHMQDEAGSINRVLDQAMEDCDVLILSGGVSHGKFDLVPEVLAQRGVRRRFHGVSQRPGKPFWYGTGETVAHVFALPGNPVSTVTCFHRYVLGALDRMQGLPVQAPSLAQLTEPFAFQPPLTCLLPVRLRDSGGGLRCATPFPVTNSGDYASLVESDGFVELAGEEISEFPLGFAAPFFQWL